MSVVKVAIALVVFGIVVVTATILLMDRLVVGPTVNTSKGLVSDAVEKYRSPMLTEEDTGVQTEPPRGARAEDLILDTVGQDGKAEFRHVDTSPSPEAAQFDEWGSYRQDPGVGAVTLYVRAVSGSMDEAQVRTAAQMLGAEVVMGKDVARTDLGKRGGTALIRNGDKSVWGRIWYNDRFLLAATGPAKDEVDDFVELYPY